MHLLHGLLGSVHIHMYLLACRAAMPLKALCPACLQIHIIDYCWYNKGHSPLQSGSLFHTHSTAVTILVGPTNFGHFYYYFNCMTSNSMSLMSLVYVLQDHAIFCEVCSKYEVSIMQQSVKCEPSWQGKWSYPITSVCEYRG